MSSHSYKAERAAYLAGTGKSGYPDEPVEPRTNYFIRAVVFGVVAAIIGALIYALFSGITGIGIGILAPLVGYLVAKAMRIGSQRHVGRKYQLTAVVLIYLAVSAATTAVVCWNIREETPLTSDVIFHTAKYGLEFPLWIVQQSPVNGGITLFIFVVSLFIAWRMLAATRVVVQAEEEIKSEG